MLLLYPTETLYALGVNALEQDALTSLYTLKERDLCKPASWLVRSIEDIRRYAEVSALAERLATRFLPGSLTLVLPALISVSDAVVAPDRTIAFRISSDPVAQEVIADFMEEHHAPLTCTSANVSGSPTLPTPGEILQQFGPRARMITRVIDDGPRKGLASTIVRVVGDNFTLLREGEITEADLRAAAA
jgi:L-threonylcarbamoyladenylate synthase